ncbi:Uncharacterised protein [Mycobacteroides abscessus subsp. abscessus]|nr:Uncharacterised protein [Mycobacteroides abscessus subsp. abscessus]
MSLGVRPLTDRSCPSDSCNTLPSTGAPSLSSMRSRALWSNNGRNHSASAPAPSITRSKPCTVSDGSPARSLRSVSLIRSSSATA